MAGMLVNDFIRDFKVGYPVGFSTMPNALHYLQIDPMKRWVVPQVVMIDRKGQIIAQYMGGDLVFGKDLVEREKNFRKLIEDALKKPGATAAPAKKVPVTRKTS